MKLVIEVDLDAAGSTRNLWEILPDALSSAGMAAAEAGAIEGTVNMPYSRSRDGAQIGKWWVE